MGTGLRQKRLVYERFDSAREDLERWMADNPGEDPEREIDELADLAVPCYASQVLDLAADIPSSYWADDGRAKAEVMVARAAFAYFHSKLVGVAAYLRRQAEKAEEERGG